MSIQGYDQWKTASPYDDEPDWVDEAENWCKVHPATDPESALIVEIIKGLLLIIEEET